MRIEQQPIRDAQEWNNFWGKWRPVLQEKYGDEKTSLFITNWEKFKTNTGQSQTEVLEFVERAILLPMFGDDHE